VEFYEQEAEFMEFNMEEVYASVYKNEELSQGVCNVQVSAFQELQDKYGQAFVRRVYVTSMDKATASKVGDWLMVEQPAIWTVNKMHPVVEAELAQNAAEKAVAPRTRASSTCSRWSAPKRRETPLRFRRRRALHTRKHTSR
jgi:hypothetical protein